MTDWFLPSPDELTALYYYTNRDAIGGFNSGRYWSSNLVSLGPRYVDFGNGKEDDGNLKQGLGVRPIRAF